MRALITNDDGWDAPGLQLLARVARDVFEEVVIVAPASEMSAVSHGLTLHHPLRWWRKGEDVWAVNGTPVDCVLVALGHILADRRPDIVLSGVNNGPNLGFDVHYSGTVAGAREGHIKGILAMALSLVGPAPFDFEAVAPVVRHVLTGARDGDFPEGALLNVNIPKPEAEAEPGLEGVPGIRGVRVTRIGQRAYRDEIIVRKDPRGMGYAWIGGGYPQIVRVEGTDGAAILDKYVSVTPLQLDTTDLAALGGLEAWNRET